MLQKKKEIVLKEIVNEIIANLYESNAEIDSNEIQNIENMVVVSPQELIDTLLDFQKPPYKTIQKIKQFSNLTA